MTPQATAGVRSGGIAAAYAYNAKGVRTAKEVNGLRTSYLLDGGSVVGEIQNHAVTASYVWGANLISSRNGLMSDPSLRNNYYFYNAHGDVVQLVDDRGNITGSYDYDAFGNEKAPSGADTNPFRYCGEYLDLETGTYYLRARYYDPALGRFTQADTHWNTANMIYGDNPQTINHRQDALGLTSYTHVPQITAVAQSGNLYVYGISSPVTYIDRSGKTAELALAATAFVDPALGAAVFVVGAFIAVVGIIADAASKNGKPVTPVKPTGAASSPASPPPPNDNRDPKYRGDTVYHKNNIRIDYESYGNGTGNIHVHTKSGKFYYDSINNVFRIGNSVSSKLAPKNVQNLLKSQEIARAIIKALKYIRN